MVRPDLSAWGHTLADLRRLAVQAQHPRSRERILALYMIASQQTNATTWAAHIGRAKETVLIGCINTTQPGRPRRRHLSSHRGPFPPFDQERRDQLTHTVVESDPIDHGLSGHAWTLHQVQGLP